MLLAFPFKDVPIHQSDQLRIVWEFAGRFID